MGNAGFGHMTLIVNESGRKLSKRDEAIIQFIEQYEELGYCQKRFSTLSCCWLVAGWGRRNLFERRTYFDL